MTASDTIAPAAAGPRDATEIFGEFVAGGHGDAIPATVRSAAARYLLDAMGCAIGGAGTAPVRAARAALARRPDGAPGAHLLGTADTCDAASAAFLNTLAARAFLFDDTFGDGHLHPGAALAGVALAMAEREQLSFAAVVDAFVAGAEIALRISYVAGEASYLRGFHNTGTCLVFGCAAAAASALRLTADQARVAINLAGERACGLRRYQRAGQAAHSGFHAASAAASGIECALLAAAGFPEPAGMITGELGFLTSYCPDADPATLDVAVGTDWWTPRIGIKAFPGCRGTHPAVASARALLRELSASAADVAGLDIAVSPLEASLVDRPDARDPLAANFSIQYAVARQAVSGRLLPAHYSEAAIREPAVQEFMRSVAVRTDPDLAREAPVRSPIVVTCRLRDGRSATASLEYPPGEPENPLADADLIAKFTDNAGDVLGHDQAGRAARAILAAPDGAAAAASVIARCVVPAAAGEPGQEGDR
ncbi:MAG TPA: MmgE/PrpD family protein [Streptosporangiaceae bacterium]|nr:MmgE/PrpD family protein [Streptosporangiaceae bacterium]